MYKPTSPYPYMETINGESEGVFICAINSRDIIYAYGIYIRDAYSNELIYQDKAVLDTPVYTTTNKSEYLKIPVPSNTGMTNGHDYTWSIRLCGKPHRRYVNTISNTYAYLNKELEGAVGSLCQLFLTNGTKFLSSIISRSAVSTSIAYEIKPWPEELKVGDALDIYTDYVDSDKYFFKARTPAHVEADISSTITSNEIDVGVEYIQKENVSIAYYKFNLYLNSELIHSTGNVMSPYIHYHFGGLKNGGNYLLELTTVDDENTQTVSTWDFKASYQTNTSMLSPVLSLDYDKMCVKIDYSNLVTIPAVKQGYGECSFMNFKNPGADDIYNGIAVPSGVTLSWDKTSEEKPLNIEDTIQLLHWHGHNGFYGNIIEKSDASSPLLTISASYDGTAFYYKIAGEDKVTVPIYEKTSSAIVANADGNITEDSIVIDEDTVYILNDDDVLKDTDILICNDLTNKYWWHITIYNDRVDFIRGNKFSDTVVN